MMVVVWRFTTNFVAGDSSANAQEDNGRSLNTSLT
ncbi:hypothetical protein OESDEN_04143 [Oesophagostomum dentatum]|uniref:Uncharacterized protein n=1 Tax=Oesophagostomum dentatum TaxID=61180 RepID=A0A0B1TEA8_OESDE|nr:hypothetical protein OESDEN_04143 [Oesophagostomum dentatum]